MKKILNLLLKVLGVILICILIFLVIMFIYHNIMLKVEESKLVPNGKMVSVFDTEYHLYTEGQGEKTIILLSGWGVTSSVYEYKALYSKLSDKYKIVVIEKPGSGYTKDTNRDRNLKNIIEEYRYILEKENIKGPYVLMPHSAGGIEAIYWLENYKEEVESIISLDMTIPKQSIYASNMRNDDKISYAISDFIELLGSKTGLIRFSFVKDMFIDRAGLNDLEYEQNELLWYKNAYSSYVIKELTGVFYAGNEINEQNLNYEIPIIEFMSKTLQDYKELADMHSEFITKFTNHKVVKLENALHTMYRTDYEKISNEIKEFLK